MSLGHDHRRLRKLSDQVATCFAAIGSRDGALDQGARHYHEAMRHAFEVDLSAAVILHQDYDARIPADRYPLTSSDHVWLPAAASPPPPRLLGIGRPHRARIRPA